MQQATFSQQSLDKHGLGQAGEVPPELRAAPQGVLVHRLFG